MLTEPSGPFHLNFDVNGDNKCSNARRACAVIVNYFKHMQRGRRALSILKLTLKFKWNGPLGTPQKIIYPNCGVFCSASRRNDRRMVNYVTVIATQKLDENL